jgi:hypothetical protein
MSALESTSLVRDRQMITIGGDFPVPSLTAKELWDYYSTCWDSVKCRFQFTYGFDASNFLARVERHVRGFGHPEIDETEHFGFKQKFDIAPIGGEVRVVICADLHTDLKSLLDLLQQLRLQGLLDEEFRCVNSNVHLLFLGDYMDRCLAKRGGASGVQVLELLLCMREENRGQVHLLRGDHEEVLMNRKFMVQFRDELLLSVLNINQVMMENLYRTFPLEVFLSVDKGSEPRTYVLGVHGFPELLDTSEWLDSAPSGSVIPVPRVRKVSERILGLAGEVPKAPMSTSTKGHYVQSQYYQGLVQAGKIPQSELDKINHAYRHQRHLDLQLFHGRITEDERQNAILFVDAAHREGQVIGSECVSVWGDVINSDFSHLPVLGQERELDPFKNPLGYGRRDVEIRLKMSSSMHRVCQIFRGHEQAMWELLDEAGSPLVTTLPAGADAAFKQLQLGLMLCMRPDDSQWTKRLFFREPGQDGMTVHEGIFPFSQTIAGVYSERKRQLSDKKILERLSDPNLHLDEGSCTQEEFNSLDMMS